MRPPSPKRPDRWPYAYPGSWAPNPVALGNSPLALARRYNGSFPDPVAPGRALPAVRLLQAWNEPNLARYLEPQWVVTKGRWRAFSPLLYRQLLNAFYAGVKSVEPRDTVVAAGVAPNGEPAGVGRMTPVRFLRGMLCLEGERASACPDPPHFDVLAFHPLSFESPDRRASSQTWRSRTSPRSPPCSRRPSAGAPRCRGRQAPVGHRAQLGKRSPGRARRARRACRRGGSRARCTGCGSPGVGLADWQFLIDPYPDLLLATPTGGTVEVSRPAGLYSAGVGGGPRPCRRGPSPSCTGFTFPFDPLRVDRERVRLWALLTRPGQTVLLQREGRAAAWRTIARLRADREAVLNAVVRTRGAAVLRLSSGTLRSALRHSYPRAEAR